MAEAEEGYGSLDSAGSNFCAEYLQNLDSDFSAKFFETKFVTHLLQKSA